MSKVEQYVNQDVLKMFPRTTTKGKIIVDERCECGHLRSSHAGIAFVAGHERCCYGECECQKFSWADSVMGRQSKRR